MKLSKIVLYIIIAIAVVVMGLFFFGGGSEQTLSDAADAKAFYVPNYTSLAINLATVLLFVAIGAAVLLAVWGFIQAPKQSAKSLLGLALLGGVLLVAYLSSDATPITLSDGKVFSDAFQLKLADVCLTSAFLLLILTIGAIGFNWVMRLIK